MSSTIVHCLLVSGIVFALCSCSSAPKKSDVNKSRAKAYAAYNELDAADSQGAAPVQRNLQTVPARKDEPASCIDNGLRGKGVADSYQAALLIAQRDIAAQIESSVKSKTEMTQRSEVDAEGNEIVQSSYDVQSRLLTKLENAQDVKVVSSNEKDGQFIVEACMSYDDAAFPFKKKMSGLQDSVKLGISLWKTQTNPVQKNKIYKKTKSRYVNMKAVAHILEGLNFANPAIASLDSDFEQMKNDYLQFRSNFAMYADASLMGDSLPGPQLKKLIFERISKNFPVRYSACESGLKLSLAVSPAACSEGGFGMSCSVDVTLRGESCDEEIYFNLSSKVKGGGRYDEKEALNRLEKNLSEGSWFDEWARELKKWKFD